MMFFDFVVVICHDELMLGSAVINIIIFGVIAVLFGGFQLLHILPDWMINGPVGFILQMIIYVGLFFYIALWWRNRNHKRNMARLEQEKAILLMGAQNQQQQKQATQQQQPQSLQ
jgi:hypothetical protein